MGMAKRNLGYCDSDKGLDNVPTTSVTPGSAQAFPMLMAILAQRFTRPNQDPTNSESSSGLLLLKATTSTKPMCE